MVICYYCLYCGGGGGYYYDNDYDDVDWIKLLDVIICIMDFVLGSMVVS